MEIKTQCFSDSVNLWWTENHKTEVQTKLESLKTKIQYLATSRADTPLGTTY